MQSLRTCPQFNYKIYNILPKNDPLSFAPEGLFEIKTAWKKAILAAQKYIYMEDQMYWSHEIMCWVNQAIASNPNLRVILVTSGGADPNDPDFSDSYFANAINNGLLKGKSELTEVQQNQVRMFQVESEEAFMCHVNVAEVTEQVGYSTVQLQVSNQEDSDKLNAVRNRGWAASLVQLTGEFPIIQRYPNINVVNYTNAKVSEGPAELWAYPRVTVHSKVTLIDDHWAIVGSANIGRRSLYTDLEHAVSFVDEDDLVVKEFRKNLWSDHFHHNSPDDFDDIDAGLHAWEETWGTAGAAPNRPLWLRPVTLPVSSETEMDDDDQHLYDRYLDPDSRENWGGVWK